MEAPLRRLHLSEHEVENLLGYLSIVRIPGSLKGFKIGMGKERLIVQHFLEMRNQPLAVDAVAMETEPYLVENSSLPH